MEHFFNKIEGWFSFGELYRDAVYNAKDGDVFVEVGSWKGRSAAFMAVEIINSKKKIDFYCVDSWQGDISCSDFAQEADREMGQREIRKGTLTATCMPSIEAKGRLTAHPSGELASHDRVNLTPLDLTLTISLRPGTDDCDPCCQSTHPHAVVKTQCRAIFLPSSINQASPRLQRAKRRRKHQSLELRRMLLRRHQQRSWKRRSSEELDQTAYQQSL